MKYKNLAARLSEKAAKFEDEQDKLKYLVQFCVSMLSLVQSSLASVLVPQSSITQSSITQSSVPQCSITQSSGHLFF